MSETQGISAMSLLGANRGAEQLPGGMGGQLGAIEMAQRQKFAPPIGGQDMGMPAADAPQWYNYSGMAPAKWSIPTQQKDRLVARAAVREAAAAAGSSAVPRPDPISEEEINYVQAMEAQAELANFDRYINTLVDVRKQGNLK